MRRRLLVVAEAEQQIREAADWWRANRPAARGMLRQELARGFDLITTHPEIGVQALDAPIAGVRRLHLLRTRYYLYYRLRAGAVEVLALWHTSRGTTPPL